RWSPPSCCNFRCAARSATGCALSPVAVLASEGSLVVITRNRWIELRPERDGDTTVVNVSAVKYPVGTRVEINFGPALPDDSDALFWAAVAQELSLFGTSYVGKSSPWWYDAAQFHELLYASSETPVRELISQLDGCSGGKAEETWRRPDSRARSAATSAGRRPPSCCRWRGRTPSRCSRSGSAASAPVSCPPPPMLVPSAKAISAPPSLPPKSPSWSRPGPHQRRARRD